LQRKTGERMDFEEKENMGYAMGEAEDWLDRSVVDITDWITDVQRGKLTFDDLRGRILVRFREGQKEMNDWRNWWGWTAREAGLPYVRDELTIPMIRLIAPLPDVTA